MLSDQIAMLPVIDKCRINTENQPAIKKKIREILVHSHQAVASGNEHAPLLVCIIASVCLTAVLAVASGVRIHVAFHVPYFICLFETVGCICEDGAATVNI